MLKQDITSDGIAILTMAQDRAMNVITMPFVAEFTQAIDTIAQNDAVKGVIITSDKSSFLAGGDLSMLRDLLANSKTVKDAIEAITPIQMLMRKIETCGKPVVGASTGTALGGGLEMLLACHYRLVAANDEAHYGLPEARFGLLPGAGGTQRLTRVIGVKQALPLALKGAFLSTQKAFDLGILDEIVPAEQLMERAKALVLSGDVASEQPWDDRKFKLPGNPVNSTPVFDQFLLANAQVHAETRGNYPAPLAILTCVFEGGRLPIDKGLKVEREMFGSLASGNVAPAMIQTQFYGRQKVAKEKWSAPDADSPFAQAIKAGFDGQIARMQEAGHQAAYLKNAAIAMSLPQDLAGGVSVAPASEPTRSDMVEGKDLKSVGKSLIHAMALAAAEQFVAGAFDDPVKIDLAAIDACGFPTWTGGPLMMIDAMGLAAFLEQCRADGMPISDALAAFAKSNDRFHPEGVGVAA